MADEDNAPTPADADAAAGKDEGKGDDKDEQKPYVARSKLGRFIQAYSSFLSSFVIGVAGLCATSLWQWRQSEIARRQAESQQQLAVIKSDNDWRIARAIFVADDDRVAERYGKRDAASPYRFYWQQLRVKLTISRRHIVFKTHEAQPDAELTDDYVVDRLVIAGTVNKVVDGILALREQVGDFGELVYAGMDWVDPKLELPVRMEMTKGNAGAEVVITSAYSDWNEAFDAKLFSTDVPAGYREIAAKKE